MAQKARRDRRLPPLAAGSGEDAVDGPEPFDPDLAVGLDRQTAMIPEVTSEMMDAAAQTAAHALAADPDRPLPARLEGQATAIDGPDVASAAPMTQGTPSVDAAAEPAPASTVPHLGSPAIAMKTAAIEPDDGVDQEALPSRVATMPPLSTGEDHGAALPSAAGEDASGLSSLSSGLAARAERTPEALEPNRVSTGASLDLVNTRIGEMLASNLAANRDFLKALMDATTLTEVVAVNTEHLHRRMELLTTQGRQLTVLARTITFDAMTSWSAQPPGRGQDHSSVG